MSYESFLKLHDKVAPEIISTFQKYRRYHRKGGRKGSKGGYYKLPPIPNGVISTSVRLALALRYFAGGSPYDLMAKYGVSHTSVLESVWIVVEAIKNVRDFDIEYPSSHDEQRRIAKEFKQKSQAEFDNCAGAIDGILIWTHKPSEKECIRSKVEVRIPTALMGGGDHYNDISRNQRTTHERRNPDSRTPRYKLLHQVISKHMKRPLPMKHD
jgi:hypothetical protein